MAEKHINKNKFKGSLETVFTDIVCSRTDLYFNDTSDSSYFPVCSEIWNNYPDEFPSPIFGPVPFNISGYVENNRPCFQQPLYNHCPQWPVLITPSGIVKVNEEIKDSNLVPLNFPLGPHQGSNLGFSISRKHIFIGSEKLITKYSDINNIKKYPQYWKEVWVMSLDLDLYNLNPDRLQVFARKVFEGSTEEYIMLLRRFFV